jgi:hypothetical protein
MPARVGKADAAIPISQPSSHVGHFDHPSDRSASAGLAIDAPQFDVSAPVLHEQRSLRVVGLNDAPQGAMVTFDTEYGGLFFALNAALHLGYYGDFTRPLQQGLACSPWLLLLKAGSAWAGPRFRRDPLAAWLREKSANATDRPRSPRRAVARILHALRARIALGLGCSDLRRSTRLMLELSAVVEVGIDRLDAHYLLAELPLSVRLAGLDRDPGWIPAAGCDFRFHFR